MEFWGVEVKSGQPLTVQPGPDKVLHLSQASLGEVKKDKTESVCLYVEVDGKKLVLGTLTPEKLPQQLFDLVFDRDFVLTHNSKHGSIYFYGYIADQPFDEDPDHEFDSDSEDDEAIPLQAADNGKLEEQPKQEKKAPVVAAKAKAGKDSNAGKQKVKIVEPSKEDDSSDESDDSDDSDDAMSEDDELDSEDGLGDSDSDEDSSDDEETPQKVQSGKKRPSESATKTPVPDKKAKLVTPQKTDGKKGGGHVATPHPSKQAAKTPANKSNQKSPKSGEGALSCQSCKKNFNSEVALSSHNKAKHSAAK